MVPLLQMQIAQEVMTMTNRLIALGIGATLILTVAPSGLHADEVDSTPQVEMLELLVSPQVMQQAAGALAGIILNRAVLKTEGQDLSLSPTADFSLDPATHNNMAMLGLKGSF